MVVDVDCVVWVVEEGWMVCLCFFDRCVWLCCCFVDGDVGLVVMELEG